MHGTGKSGKRKPQKTPPPLEDAEQYKRFVETAKKLEVDASGKAFTRAVSAVLPQKSYVRPKK